MESHGSLLEGEPAVGNSYRITSRRPRTMTSKSDSTLTPVSYASDVMYIPRNVNSTSVPPMVPRSRFGGVALRWRHAGLH